MLKEEKKKPKGINSHTYAKQKVRAARQHSQAIAFKVAGIPKEKHTFTTKQEKGGNRKINMKT